MTVRYTILTLALVALAGITTGCQAGPGSDCNECVKAEATPMPGGNTAAAAAAASAKGGTEIKPTAHSGETGFTPTVKTTIGRGAGDTHAESADKDTRHTASGGAVDMSVMGNPTDALASASASSGGVGASVQEAQATVASWRSLLAIAATENPVDMAKLEFYRSSLVAASAALNATSASAASQRPSLTINYNQHGDPTLINVSSSSTAGRPDPDSVKAAVDGVGGAAASSAKPAAKAVPDDLKGTSVDADTGKPIKPEGE